MNKLTEVDLYLLRNWGEVERLQEATASMKEKLMEFVKSALPYRRWWEPDFRPPEHSEKWGDVYVHKKQWVRGKGMYNRVHLGVCGLRPEDLWGSDPDDPPAGYIWIGGQPSDRRAGFNRKFKKFARYSPTRWKSLGLFDYDADDDEYTVWLEVKRSREEWLRLLQSGRYVEEVCKVFDRLAQFIDPVDRTLAALRASATRKKR